MSFSISKSIITSLGMGIISIIIFVSCDELEPVNPADPAYTLKPPTLVSAQAITDIQIDLTWKNNEEHAEEFVIQRKSSSGSYSAIGSVTENILTFTDTTCVLGTEYSYVIQSKVESNLSAHSNTLEKATSFTPLSNVSASAISDSEIQLTWTDNIDYEIGFKIERDSGAGFIDIDTVSSDVTEYTDSGLTFGQSYDYRVAAYTSVNNSSWATITASTEFPAPSHLTASGVSDSEIQLTWTDNIDYEIGFKIERDSGAGFIDIDTVSSDVTEYTDSGLTFGQSYDYRVAAYTSVNTSDYSATATAIAMASMVDYDGNVYQPILIGNQVWIAENLKVTHYRNGNEIPTGYSNADWSILDNTETGAYAVYDDNESNADTYGYLYNWYAVDTMSHNIAPEGWHVPTDADWTELKTYLSNNGHSGSEGTALKSMMGWNYSGNGTDDYGYTALPGGYRYYNGSYNDVGNYAYFWSATEHGSYNAWRCTLHYGTSGINLSSYYKGYGFAIRLLRD
jgi:uncharacterized protein (TIGR02145 family)